jgi:hypothetical protein
MSLASRSRLLAVCSVAARNNPFNKRDQGSVGVFSCCRLFCAVPAPDSRRNRNMLCTRDITQTDDAPVLGVVLRCTVEPGGRGAPERVQEANLTFE